MENSSIIIFAVSVGIAILLFGFLRAVMLWYWKIDKLVENQQKQTELLTELLAVYKKVNDYPS